MEGTTDSSGGNRRRALPLAVLTMAAAVGVAAPAGPAAAAGDPAPAVAQAAERRAFDIAPQPLADALARFGRQSGLQVSVDAAAVRGLPSPGVRGTMAPEQALRALLSGTGITWRFDGAGTVMLTKADAAGDTMRLDPITVEGAGESAYGPVEGYAAGRSATATKTDTPIFETPAAVQVVPRDVIDDQAAQSLKDVYENVSGVAQAGNTLNAQSEVLPMIRGFESATLLRNGMRARQVGTVDLVNVERVEVLKGPASILHGALDPGGIVNIVTKRPQHEAAYELEQQVGSYRHLRTTVDLTGPVGEGDDLAFRLNGAYTDSDSFRDHIHLRRTAIAPSLLWQPWAGTELLLDLSYVEEEQPYDAGVPIGFNNEQLVPDDTFFNDPDLKGRELEDWYARLQVSHAIDDVWTVRPQVQVHRANARNEAIRPRGLRGSVGAEEIRARYQNEDRTDDELQTTLDLTGEFDALGAGHTLLLGSEFLHQDQDFSRYRENLSNITVSADPAVNFDPPSSQPQQEKLGETRQVAVYLQDQVSLLEDGRLKLLFGGRYDWLHQNSSTDLVADPDVNDGAFSGRAGVLYEATDALSLYTSYSQSFQAQNAGTVDTGGTPLDPEKGEQYEAGIKAKLFGDRVLATASVYQIEKTDVAVFDSDHFNDTGESAYFPGVEHRSRGFELDVTGAITDRLEVFAAYGYTDSEVLKNEGDPTTVGERLGNVPLQTVRLWLSYAFGEGSQAPGLNVAGGLRHVSKNTAQFDDDVELDAYTVFDLAAWYDLELDGLRGARLRLNVDNVFDTHYYARASDASIVHPGAPRTVIGSLTLRF